MPTFTVRPNETVSGSANFTITGGAATIDAALSDNNVGTYITKSAAGNGAVIVGFGTTSIASTQRVSQVRIRSQVLCPTTSSRLRITPIVRVDGVNYFGAAQALSGSFILAEYSAGYQTSAPDGNAWDQTRIDTLRAQIQDNATGANVSNVYELFFDIVTTTQPTVSVSAPTGTVANTTQPDISWAYSDADGTNQDYYEARVFSSTQYSAAAFDPSTSDATWESGAVASDDNTITIATHLAQGATYRAYVRVAKLVSNVPFYSSWAYSQFTVNPPVPGTPTLNSASYQSATNRVYLQLTAVSVSGSFASQILQVQRSDDLEVTWGDVIGASSLVPSGALSSVIYDYAAPRNTAVRYRVRSIATQTDYLTASAWSSAASVSIPAGTNFWIKSLSNPNLNQSSLRVRAPLDEKVEEQIGVFRPIGRANAVTVSAGLQGRDGTFNVSTVGETDFNNVWALLSNEGVLLVQYPDDTQRFIRIVNRSFKQSGKLSATLTEFTVEYVEVDA
jgi:hypothetical protein